MLLSFFIPAFKVDYHKTLMFLSMVTKGFNSQLFFSVSEEAATNQKRFQMLVKNTFKGLKKKKNTILFYNTIN